MMNKLSCDKQNESKLPLASSCYCGSSYKFIPNSAFSSCMCCQLRFSFTALCYHYCRCDVAIAI